jgi:hypothetical protein
MSTTPGFASTARVSVGLATTADTSRTAPTTRALVFPAGPNGSRIERIGLNAIGTTIASSLRIFLMQGNPVPAIASITFSTTTATATTVTPHGMKTGDLVTVWGASPSQYNVTVTTTTAFTYTMAAAPAVNAVLLGQASFTPATPALSLWQEIPFTAITPSTSIAPYNSTLEAVTTPEKMPILLQPGWSIVATVNDTQTSSGINVIAFGGDF